MVDTYTTPCQYAHCKYTCPLSICPPLVNMPASCQHLHQYAHPLSTPTLLSTCPPTVDTPALLLICPHPVDTPAPCQYACLLSTPTSICPPCCWYTHPLSTCLPAVDTPTHCQYICPAVNMPTSCQYTHLLSICPPVVHIPTMWLIQLPPVNMPTSCWCSCPYRYICTHVVVVCHGAADDVAGSMDAIMPTSLKEERGKECELTQSLPVGGTCEWWEEQWHFSNCIVTQVTGVTQSHNTST